jgi:hypothetical protein
MPTIRTSFRLTKSDLAQIDELGRSWGPVQPLDRTAVIREAVRRASHAESTARSQPAPKGRKAAAR